MSTDDSDESGDVFEAVTPIEGLDFAPMSVSPPVRSRYGVSGYVYYQSADQEPRAVDLRFGGFTQSEEAPFTRPNLKLCDEWQEVDFGWLKDHPISVVVVENPEGRFTQVQPTDEQRKEAQARIIELGASDPGGLPIQAFAVVLPGESAVFRPCPGKLWIRTRNTPSRANLTAFPA